MQLLDPAPVSMNRNELKMDDEDFFKGHVRKFMKHVETMPEKPEYHADAK